MSPSSAMQNLTLVLDGPDGGPEVRIATCDRVMANASPFFEAMLRVDRFKEGTELAKRGSLEIPLPDTNAEAMTVLCNIFHLRSDKVPIVEITLDLLAEIATLVDKYDCACALQPWPKIWIQQRTIRIDIENLYDMDLDQIVKWVHIAGQLGFAEEFKRSTLYLTARADCHIETKTKRFASLRPSLQDSVLKIRDTCATSLYNTMMKIVKDLENGSGCEALTLPPSNDVENFNCSSLLLGNALLALAKTFGPDWKDKTKWTDSVTTLCEKAVLIAHKLNGPRMLCHIDLKEDCKSCRRHTDCSREAELLEQIEFIELTAMVNFGLREMGNVFYRGQST